MPFSVVVTSVKSHIPKFYHIFCLIAPCRLARESHSAALNRFRTAEERRAVPVERKCFTVAAVEISECISLEIVEIRSGAVIIKAHTHSVGIKSVCAERVVLPHNLYDAVCLIRVFSCRKYIVRNYSVG